MRRAIALGGIEQVAEPTRKDVPRRKRGPRRARDFAYVYGPSWPWPSMSGGVVTASSHPGPITGTWVSPQASSTYQSLLGSSLRQRVYSAKLAWETAHPSILATWVLLGRQERQELDEILKQDLPQSYDSSMLGMMSVNIVGLRIMFADADSILEVS